MAVTTIAEFLDLLEKSALLAPQQLQETRAGISQGDDPVAVARRLVEAQLLTDWQGAQLVAGRSSFQLGKYRLIRLLGRGGMGGVFLAEHMMMNRRVALKTISRDFGNTPGSLEQFLLEARTIAALDHPNIVQAYSFDQEGGRFFLVMEFIEGQDLEQLVETQGPLDGGVAGDYIRQAADGLQHGHERKIIHCDIKPSNLLLSHTAVIKIVDMGMSRLQDPNEAQKDSGGEMLGSVDYLAPEQAIGSKDFDHRADIYSLGCTLYFLLTGRPPFPEGMLHEKLMKHQTIEPERIETFRADLSDKLIDVCEKMMAKEPAERYQSAEEVSKALSKLPAPKRKAKAAAPLKKAQPIGATAQEQAPLIDLGDSNSSVMERLTPRASLTKTGAGKGDTRYDKGLVKIVAGAGAAVVLLLLLAILLPSMLGSNEEVKDNKPVEEVSAPPGDIPPAEERSLVFDFETGDLQGWRVVEGEFKYPVSDREEFHNDPKRPYHKQGRYYLSTLETGPDKPGDDKMTGVVESPVFVLSEPEITAMIGGGAGKDTYVALCTLEGKEARKRNTEPAEMMQEIEWNVPQLVDKPVFFRVVDHASGQWGHITLDNIRASGRLDKAATDKRFAALDAEPGDSPTGPVIKPGPGTPGAIALKSLPGAGNEAFGGNLGLDFDVLSPIEVTELGIFDSRQDGFIGTLAAGLWSRSGDSGKLLASLEFTPEDGGRLEKGTGSRFKPLAEPLLLERGAYTISGSGFTASDLYSRTDKENHVVGPADDGGGLISFGTFSRWVETEGFPAKHDNRPNNWAAGTFKFRAAGDTTSDLVVNDPGEKPVVEPPPGTQDPKKLAVSREGNLAYLNMDEESGDLRDGSGNDHHGKIRGSVEYNKEGKHAGALKFNGGHVVLEGSKVMNHNADFTWMAWIKPGKKDGTVISFTNDQGDWPHGGKCLFLEGGKLKFDVGFVGVQQSPDSLQTREWHHVALTADFDTGGDKDTTVIYLDGKEISRKSDWNVNKHGEGDFVLKVGYCSPNFGKDTFRGLMDDVTVWNRVLPPDEIAAAADPDAVPAKPRANAFQNLAKTGNLPLPDKVADPIASHILGELVLEPEQEATFQLLGGKNVLAKGQQLWMQYDDAKGFWVVNLKDEDGSQKSVAAIVVRDRKIHFRWSPAVPPGIANRLLCCGLNITVGEDSHFLPLGGIKQTTPVQVNLERAAGKAFLPEMPLSDLESLRLQIARLDGGFPEPQFNPGSTVFPGNMAEIKFDKKDFPDFRLYVAFKIKPRPTVEVRAGINYEWEKTKMTEVRPFRLQDAMRVGRSMMAEEAKRLQELEQTDVNDKRKVNDLKNKLMKLQEKIRKLKLLNEIYAKSKRDPVKLQFGIFSQVDDSHGIPLLVSIPVEELNGKKPAPAEEPGAAKP